MDAAKPKYPEVSANPRQRMDFGPAKSSDVPVPVTSAKAAINAMFAKRAKAPQATLAPSAREIVNANSSREQHPKSAANLHHGSIQKSMEIESTRTSASALLRSAKSDGEKKPVVRTSLKLGADARPKQPPVVLPPHARMAQQARPVAKAESEALPVQITPKKAPLPRSRRQIRDPQMLPARRHVVASPHAQTIAIAAKAQPAEAAPAVPEARTGSTTPVPRAAARPSFRSAPKGRVLERPEPVIADESYVMSAPPKLSARAAANMHKDLVELGISEDATVADVLERPGDKAPIGRVHEQAVASGRGGAAPEAQVNEYNTIKSRNTSNYSFSRHDAPEQPKPDDKHYKPVDQSAFLRSVSVEKRPLSGGIPSKQVSNYGQSESYQVPGKKNKASKTSKGSKPAKPSRKNVYAREADDKPSRRDAPSRPVVIIPSSRRSKAPLFFLILFTIVLGAAVGAAAYLCFFQ